MRAIPASGVLTSVPSVASASVSRRILWCRDRRHLSTRCRQRRNPGGARRRAAEDLHHRQVRVRRLRLLLTTADDANHGSANDPQPSTRRSRPSIGPTPPDPARHLLVQQTRVRTGEVVKTRLLKAAIDLLVVAALVLLTVHFVGKFQQLPPSPDAAPTSYPQSTIVSFWTELGPRPAEAVPEACCCRRSAVRRVRCRLPDAEARSVSHRPLPGVHHPVHAPADLVRRLTSPATTPDPRRPGVVCVTSTRPRQTVEGDRPVLIDFYFSEVQTLKYQVEQDQEGAAHEDRHRRRGLRLARSQG
jgi:hypothetical protein